MWKLLWQIFMLLLIGLGLPQLTSAQTEPGTRVQAVLFYSPTCPHCQTVINETLIPLVDANEGQLEILAFDVSQAGGQQFYQATVLHFEVPEDRLGVPTLVVGDVILVGAAEIPGQFPTIVEQGLKGEGIPWPEIPGLAEALSKTQSEDNPGADTTPTAQPEPTVQAEATTEPQPTEEFDPPTRPATVVPESSATAGPQVIAEQTNGGSSETEPKEEPFVLNHESGDGLVVDSENPPADPIGFAIAGLILLAMLIATGYVFWRIITTIMDGHGAVELGIGYARNWIVPLLAIAGLGVAVYLAYVELTQVVVVCGPVGYCNIVQSSPYAQIIGVPVALLGAISYVAIFILWLGQHYFGSRLGSWPTLALMGLTVFGTLFSIYLTLLELFVIHAVCAWCMTSAVIILLLMLIIVVAATAERGKQLPAAL